jgi:hypothetical protein
MESGMNLSLDRMQEIAEWLQKGLDKKSSLLKSLKSV